MALTEEQRLQVEANMGLIGKVLKDKLRGSSALCFRSAVSVCARQLPRIKVLCPKPHSIHLLYTT